MIRYDLIAFDLDGTLIETAPEITDAVNDTLLGRGWRPVALAEVESWIGQGTHELLTQALASAWRVTAEQVRSDPRLATVSREFNQHYERRCGTRSHPYPHVVETLRALRQRGTRLAVVTNKEQRYAMAVLVAHNLVDLFDCIVAGDTLSTKKPDPAGLLHCLTHCDTSAQHALFIGDSSIDAATARNAGVAVWLVAHGYNHGQPPSRCAPDRVLSNFFEVDVALSSAHRGQAQVESSDA